MLTPFMVRMQVWLRRRSRWQFCLRDRLDATGGWHLNFVASMRAFNPALTIVSMIPLSPVWLISFPAALWASPWMQSNSHPQATAKPAWGATTMMFIRESRWSRSLPSQMRLGWHWLVIAAVIFFFGLYEDQATYRIVADIKQSMNVGRTC